MQFIFVVVLLAIVATFSNAFVLRSTKFSVGLSTKSLLQMSKASEEKAAEKKRRQGIQDEKEDDKKDDKKKKEVKK